MDPVGTGISINAGEEPIAPGVPPIPDVPKKVRDRVERWWKETNAVPDFDRAVRDWQESHKTLMPAWYDTSDRYKGRIPKELRKRKDDRNVRVPYAYRNVLQGVAMTVPEDHNFSFGPTPVLTPEGLATSPDMFLSQFAKTLELVVGAHLAELDWQSTVEEWVQDAHCFPMAVLKVTYDAEYINNALKTHGSSPDSQDKIQRLRRLTEEYALHRFSDQAEEYREMEQLRRTLLGPNGFIQVRKGIYVETIPLNCFRFDQNIRSPSQFYRAAWMSHDALLTREEVLERYPFRELPDGSWTGLHPRDLDKAREGNPQTAPLSDESWLRRFNPGQYAGEATGRPQNRERDVNLILVREIHSLRDGWVYTLIEGISYPVAAYVPTRTTKRWYPFVPLILNPIAGQVYGVSDVSLVAEIQHRINRKRSDEEKARWISIPRGVYNTSGLDEKEALKLSDVMPGEYKGINVPGDKLENNLTQIAPPFTPESYDITRDDQDMQQMQSLPAQSMGVTSRAGFATEVQVAAQGAAISVGHRQNRVRRALEDLYTFVAEILLQNVDADEAIAIAGPHALWPKMFDEHEGIKAWATITETAKSMLEMAMMQGMPPADPDAIARELCLKQFGFPEPLTREALFRRLRCKVRVNLNSQLDRQQRLDGIQKVFMAIQTGAQAAQLSGMAFDPTVVLSLAGDLFGADDNVMRMFTPAPPPTLPPSQPPAPTEQQPPAPPGPQGDQAPQPSPSEMVPAAPERTIPPMTG